MHVPCCTVEPAILQQNTRGPIQHLLVFISNISAFHLNPRSPIRNQGIRIFHKSPSLHVVPVFLISLVYLSNMLYMEEH